MADVKFTVANAKTDSVALAEETALAEAAGIVVDSKKGMLSVEANSNLENSSSIDISESTLFKTVSIASGYEGTGVSVVGNGAVANTFYAGGTGAYFYGGDPGEKSGKAVVAADKFYGGAGADTYAYAVNGGKDVAYNYNSGDVVQILGYNSATQSLSFVDKNGGVVVTLSDSTDSTAAKNSVFTIDGKSKDSAVGGFKFVDGTGEEILTYGFTEAVVANGVAYGEKKGGKPDTASIYIGADATGEINVGHISSTAKNISGSTDTDQTVNPTYIIGNGNANKITIGAGGGTIDGGYGAKATADVLYGTAKAPVVFVYDAQNGGKDTIGDAKNTQYNYKGTDSILITNGKITTEDIAMKGIDAVITIDKNNTLTIKNALGKQLNIYNGEIGEEPDIAFGDVLPTGLVYDAKMSKITADDAVIAEGESTYRSVPSIVSYDAEDGEPLYKMVKIPSYVPITIGGEEATYADSIKDIDLSASSAPVLIDTSDHASVTSIKVGKDGSTVVSNEGTVQNYAAGNGEDIFVISANKLSIEKFKGETLTNLGAGDVLRIADLDEDADISITEKGKDLIVAINGVTLVTLKNASFDAENKLYIQDAEGNQLKEYPFTLEGVDYATKNNKIDKTAITLGGAVGSATVNAEDFGGSAIKGIDASAVTSVKGNALLLNGTSNANNMVAPTATNIKTTLAGGAGNDNYTGGGAATTYLFTAQAKAKKDVITGFKSGDVIVVDFDANSITGPDFDEETNSITYVNGTKEVNGFNDSKADVVINFDKNNSITVKNAAGKPITIVDIEGETLGTFGHILPSTSLAYDAKNTAVTLAEGATYKGDVSLTAANYYTTVKKVDMTGNSGAVAIYGNTLANELIAGDGGDTLDGGSVDGITDAKQKQIKPTADKLTGGSGADVFVYDTGYGKDSFLKFGASDVVSLGPNINKSDLTITDKGNSLTVVIGGDAVDTDKSALRTTANSTFTITKTDSSVPVTFLLGEEGAEKFVYGNLPSGASLDAKNTTLSISTDASAVVDASAINSQPKVIDGRGSGSGSSLTLIGNGNADQIYGGAGTNILFGGTAGTKAVKDQLYGGSGKDYFLFSTQDAAKGKETDIVSNYVAGDAIVLESAPDSIKADGKAITLTWNETPEGGTKAVASTLVINGAAQDATMKKFNNIDQNVAVTFMIGDIFDEDGNVAFNASNFESVTYKFDLADSKSDNAKALKKGVAWSDVENYLAPDTTEGGESEEVQFAAYDWFENAVATDNVAVSELDAILETKAITADAAEQFNGDAFFTGVGQADQSASQLAIAARHRAKK
jgi:hypothetical protein